MQIEGSRVVLTGAAWGIGRALLAALAAYPAQIAAVDVDDAGLEQAIAALPDARARILPLVLDLTRPQAVDALFERACAWMGGVDLFIANAGFAYYGPLGAPDWERIERLYALNVISPIYAVQKMAALNRGRPYKVVITASTMGLLALPGYALYAASKAALHRFAEAYRLELDDPRRLMLVYPIATRTRFFEAAAERSAPLPWPVQPPERVARAVLRGIRHDRLAVHPSPLARLVLLLDRVLPFVRRLEQRIEARRFARWLADDPRRRAG
ncbi:MAG: SDR family oxidoreductase [Anaerolineae bacterium]